MAIQKFKAADVLCLLLSLSVVDSGLGDRQVWQDFVFTCPALKSSQEQPDEKTEQSVFTRGAANMLKKPNWNLNGKCKYEMASATPEVNHQSLAAPSWSEVSPVHLGNVESPFILISYLRTDHM